jgi:hypothetical protein
MQDPPGPPSTDAKILLDVLNIPENQLEWSPDELASMWRHQLIAPLAGDLEEIIPGAAGRVEELAKEILPPVVTFSDLLLHPKPPEELLVLVKEFAKVSPGHPERPIPRDIGAALYFSVIFLARQQCGKQITSQTDDSLNRSAKWMLSISWLDSGTREIAQRHLR